MVQKNQPILPIRKASELTGVPAHTLRYWEKELAEFLQPLRTPGGQRRYDETALSVIYRLKDLIYGRRHSLAGARRELSETRKERGGGRTLRMAGDSEERLRQVLEGIRQLIQEKLLEGREPEVSLDREGKGAGR